jgi:hypothetical protein
VGRSSHRRSVRCRPGSLYRIVRQWLLGGLNRDRFLKIGVPDCRPQLRTYPKIAISYKMCAHAN